MSVGTNTLGYNNSRINDKVKACVSDGVMSSLNCPEEVELAERLIAMHPWSDMVKYARTGGESKMRSRFVSQGHQLEKTKWQFADIMDGMIGT